MREESRASRACLGRMVSYLAATEGLRQFLDIDTGLSAEGNTHEVAQRVASDSPAACLRVHGQGCPLRHEEGPVILIRMQTQVTIMLFGKPSRLDGKVYILYI